MTRVFEVQVLVGCPYEQLERVVDILVRWGLGLEDEFKTGNRYAFVGTIALASSTLASHTRLATLLPYELTTRWRRADPRPWGKPRCSPK